MSNASDTWVDAPPPVATDDPAGWIGTVLEQRYRLNEVLGEGGFAAVYRATHLSLGRDVAVKILHAEKGADANVLARFEREADVLSRLAHPGIVAATDFGVANGTPFLVMELVEGRTLRAVIDEGRLPVERALSIARQMLRALSYAHAKGVLHRDLKPGNVILFAPDATEGDEPELVAKVLDFGLAKVVRGESKSKTPITAAGVAFGTAGYVSPEVLSGRPADVRSDLYAVGVMLFEMLAGRRPYGDRNRDGELRATISSASPPSLLELVPDLPCGAELDAILQLALARRPSERFADAASMLAALEQVDPSAAARAPLSLPKKPAPPSPKSWREIQVPLPMVLAIMAVPTGVALFLAMILLVVAIAN